MLLKISNFFYGNVKLNIWIQLSQIKEKSIFGLWRWEVILLSYIRLKIRLLKKGKLGRMCSTLRDIRKKTVSHPLRLLPMIYRSRQTNFIWSFSPESSIGDGGAQPLWKSDGIQKSQLSILLSKLWKLFGKIIWWNCLMKSFDGIV